MRSLCITLPWPSSTLSPNARVHWSRRWKHVRQARFLAQCITRGSVSTPPSWVHAPMHMHIEFRAPDRRRYDRDNLVARMKAAIDGIADALGVDDHLFASGSHEVGADPGSEGCVIVTIRPLTP